ncbi:hypothetical protein [Hyphomicrobium sp.]|nr:hypothetical protein [Hyphomicrobium sp.]
MAAEDGIEAINVVLRRGELWKLPRAHKRQLIAASVCARAQLAALIALI